jgi:sulfur carrier protein ThiS
MRVHVRLHTTLRRETPEGVIDRLQLELPEGAGAHALLDALGIDPRRGVLVVVNEQLVRGDAPLSDGDHVRLVPPVSGGGGPPAQGLSEVHAFDLTP